MISYRFFGAILPTHNTGKGTIFWADSKDFGAIVGQGKMLIRAVYWAITEVLLPHTFCLVWHSGSVCAAKD